MARLRTIHNGNIMSPIMKKRKGCEKVILKKLFKKKTENEIISSLGSLPIYTHTHINTPMSLCLSSTTITPQKQSNVMLKTKKPAINYFQ